MLPRALPRFAKLSTAGARTISNYTPTVPVVRIPYTREAYHDVAQTLRSTLIRHGYQETQTGVELAATAACEDPHTVTKFKVGATDYAVHQSGQMTAEREILSHQRTHGYLEPDGDAHGVFTFSVSVRDEPSLFDGDGKKKGFKRRVPAFPMCEAEAFGTMDDLLVTQWEVLAALGLQKPLIVDYRDACEFFGVDLLDNEHEAALARFSPVVQLVNFKLGSNPYWNMKLHTDTKGRHARKVDLLIDGIECAGGAERSTNVEEMKYMFYSIEDGEYAAAMQRNFGKERVKRELDDYFALFDDTNTVDQRRWGFGIGGSRMIAAVCARDVAKYGVNPTEHGAWPYDPERVTEEWPFPPVFAHLDGAILSHKGRVVLVE